MVLDKITYIFKRYNVKSYYNKDEQGYIINDLYKIYDGSPFMAKYYRKFLNKKPEEYTYLDFQYYITQYILSGNTDINDEIITSITNKFNSTHNSQIEINTIQHNKMWEFEDKRWLVNSNTNQFFTPNKFILYSEN